MSDDFPISPDKRPDAADSPVDIPPVDAAPVEHNGAHESPQAAAALDPAEIGAAAQDMAATTVAVVADAVPAESTAPVRGRPIKPVELQAVVTSTRPSPFRFGIREMFGIMVLCGLQFALVSRLGPLWGIFDGAVVCLVLIGGLVVAAICYRPKGKSRALEYMDQLAIRLTLAVVVLFVAFIVAGGGVFVWRQSVELRRDSLLCSDLGFTGHKQSVVDGKDPHMALVIDTIAPGKPFDRAGLRKNDAVLLDEDFNLYERFEENRGRNMTLNVAPIGAGVSNTIGPVRAVTVSIPPTGG